MTPDIIAGMFLAWCLTGPAMPSVQGPAAAAEESAMLPNHQVEQVWQALARAMDSSAFSVELCAQESERDEFLRRSGEALDKHLMQVLDGRSPGGSGAAWEELRSVLFAAPRVTEEPFGDVLRFIGHPSYRTVIASEFCALAGAVSKEAITVESPDREEATATRYEAASNEEYVAVTDDLQQAVHVLSKGQFGYHCSPRKLLPGILSFKKRRPRVKASFGHLFTTTQGVVVGRGESGMLVFVLEVRQGTEEVVAKGIAERGLSALWESDQEKFRLALLDYGGLGALPFPESLITLKQRLDSNNGEGKTIDVQCATFSNVRDVTEKPRISVPANWQIVDHTVAGSSARMPAALAQSPESWAELLVAGPASVAEAGNTSAVDPAPEAGRFGWWLALACAVSMLLILMLRRR